MKIFLGCTSAFNGDWEAGQLTTLDEYWMVEAIEERLKKKDFINVTQ